jgi:enamine deaminase RidA (YjgF/YER057c/UK114 family)
LTRTNISSGYPFEDTYGYSRAVRIGDQVFVSGTTARAPHLDGDAYAQMTGAIATVVAALGEAGAELRHVVRTVIYVVDMADVPQIARAHQEAFGAIRPASTLVQVVALTPASARIEIEVTAVMRD